MVIMSYLVDLVIPSHVEETLRTTSYELQTMSYQNDLTHLEATYDAMHAMIEIP
jgi:hypothetical protein